MGTLTRSAWCARMPRGTKSFRHAYIEMTMERYATGAEMITTDVCCSEKASRRRVMSGEYERGDWNMNEFEKASDAIEKDRDYRVNNENVIEFLRGADRATVSFSQGRFISKVKKLAKNVVSYIYHRMTLSNGNVVLDLDDFEEG